MKFYSLTNAENVSARCFATTGKQHPVVMMEGYYMVVTFKQAQRLVKAGYELA